MKVNIRFMFEAIKYIYQNMAAKYKLEQKKGKVIKIQKKINFN